MITIRATTGFMLDTNHADAVAVGKSAKLIERVRALPASAWCISSITASELAYGLEKSSARSPIHQAVTIFLSMARVADWDRAAGLAYGRLRACNERTGQQMGVFDEMIAAHAMSLGVTLLSADRAFGRLPQLNVENWI